jgi:hypothetical protein
VLDELVQLLEGALVEEQLDALASRELSLGMLALHAFGAAAFLRTAGFLLEDVEAGLARRRGVAQLGYWQTPLPQAAAPQPPSPRPQPSETAEAPDEDATAKVESCLSTEPPRQVGQQTASPQRRTSFSKRWSQSVQRYS